MKSSLLMRLLKASYVLTFVATMASFVIFVILLITQTWFTTNSLLFYILGALFSTFLFEFLTLFLENAFYKKELQIAHEAYIKKQSRSHMWYV